MEKFQTLFPYIDLLWVPLALLCVPAGLRLKSALFVLACALMLRLQVQMMGELGFPNGIFKLWDMPLFTRGVVVYSLFILFFLMLTFLSPRVNGFVFIAAAISIFMAAFAISTGVMLI
jgi:hypothetical protein